MGSVLMLSHSCDDDGNDGSRDDVGDICGVFRQRIVRMNKTEDDEMDAEELTEDELKQVAGAC